jgi:hypothetical protein
VHRVELCLAKRRISHNHIQIINKELSLSRQVNFKEIPMKFKPKFVLTVMALSIALLAQTISWVLPKEWGHQVPD